MIAANKANEYIISVKSKEKKKVLNRKCALLHLSFFGGHAHANQRALFTDISLTDEHLMTTMII